MPYIFKMGLVKIPTNIIIIRKRSDNVAVCVDSFLFGLQMLSFDIEERKSRGMPGNSTHNLCGSK